METDVGNPGLRYLREHGGAPQSPVRVLFCSRSSAGAWQIRGEQIASTRANWLARNEPTAQEVAHCDLLCVVKRPQPAVIELARKMGKPIVYDIVDSWAQPGAGLKCRDVAAARELFGSAWRAIGADGYIFPTQRMQLDLGSLVRRGVTIYHHYWPQIGRNPMRDRVGTVGYEGGDFLGHWRPMIEEACARRNLRFVINPPSLADLDVVILARGGDHGSFLPRSYKSNVKLANAYGSGTPALVHVDEMSAHDTDTGDVLFFTDRAGSLDRQLDLLVADSDLRRRIHRNFLATAPRFHVDTIAGQFEAFFVELLKGHRQDIHG